MADPLLLDRVPPQNLDAERSVLGAMLLDPDAPDLASQILVPGDFYPRRHRLIYGALLSLSDAQESTDILFCEDALRKEGELEAAGGPDYLRDLLGATPSAANVEYHCQLVKESAVRRQYIRGCTEILQKAYESAVSPGELAELVETKLLPETSTSRNGGMAHLGGSGTISAVLDSIEENPLGRGEETGFYDYDRLTGGLQKSSFNLVAGQPSMGKSTWALNIILALAKKERPVGVILLEGTREEWTRRALANLAQVSLSPDKDCLLDAEMTRLLEAAGLLNSLPVYINASADQTITEIRRQARHARRQLGIELLVVDYLQLIVVPGSPPIFERITAVSTALKNLGKELEIPVLAVSQFSREAGKGDRPRMGHLKGSGQLEQDADTILILHVDEDHQGVLDDAAPLAGKFWLKAYLDKNRNAPVGQFSLSHHLGMFRLEIPAFGEGFYG